MLVLFRTILIRYILGHMLYKLNVTLWPKEGRRGNNGPKYRLGAAEEAPLLHRTTPMSANQC